MYLFSMTIAVSFFGSVSALPCRKLKLFSETVLKRMYREHNAYVQEVNMTWSKEIKL